MPTCSYLKYFPGDKLMTIVKNKNQYLHTYAVFDEI